MRHTTSGHHRALFQAPPSAARAATRIPAERARRCGEPSARRGAKFMAGVPCLTSPDVVLVAGFLCHQTTTEHISKKKKTTTEQWRSHGRRTAEAPSAPPFRHRTIAVDCASLMLARRVGSNATSTGRNGSRRARARHGGTSRNVLLCKPWLMASCVRPSVPYDGAIEADAVWTLQASGAPARRRVKRAPLRPVWSGEEIQSGGGR